MTSTEIKAYTVEQAFTVNRFARIASLYSQADSSLRSGSPLIVERDSSNQLLRDRDDKIFTLNYDARGVYGLYIMRRGYRRQMESLGLSDLAEEIITSYHKRPADRDIRTHIAQTGGY